MKSSRHFALVTLLAALHITLSVGGESLHFLPGMGHFEELPGGACVWKGLPRNVSYPGHLANPGGDLGDPQGEPGDVLGEGECLICHFVAQLANRERASSWLPAFDLRGHVHFCAPPAVAAACVSPYGARAPPC